MSFDIETKEFARLLFENRLFPSTRDFRDIIPTPEFQLLRVLMVYGELNNSELETKYEAPYSLSMLLSNLNADGLITQTPTYKWRLSDQIIEIMNEHRSSIKETEEKEHSDEEARIVLTEKQRTKNLYKNLATNLKGYSFLPSFYSSIEELFKVAEIEILAHVFNHQPISTSDLDGKFRGEGSLSLTLSNLKADGLIAEDAQYNWVLEEQFSAKITRLMESSRDEPEVTDDDHVNQPADFITETINIAEDKQFIKTVLEMGIFGNKSFKEIISTNEFKVLHIVNQQSPISQEDMEQFLRLEVPLTMLLSNLKIDGLLEQGNDYRWIFSEDFKRKIAKQKVDKHELIKEIQELQEEAAASEAAVVETMEEQPEVPEAEPVIEEAPEIVEEVKIVATPAKPTKRSSTEIIKEELIRARYIEKDSSQPLSEHPEFEILLLLSKHESMNTNEIDYKTSNVSSLSLTLSNLQADGLIEQTIDYKWKISKKIMDLISPPPTDEDLEEEELKKRREEEYRKLEEQKVKEEKDLSQFLIAAKKAGYIHNIEEPLEKLIKDPEFEVLYMLKEKEMLSADEIKSQAVSVSPVLVSRTISKLEADGNIIALNDGRFTFSDTFKHLIIEDEIKAQEEKRKEEEKRIEQERLQKLKEQESKLHKLRGVLSEEMIISTQKEDLKSLMEIPEFEIMAIISRKDEISLDEIKKEAKSVSPVLVSRTITKLEANNAIIINGMGNYELSENILTKLTRA